MKEKAESLTKYKNQIDELQIIKGLLFVKWQRGVNELKIIIRSVYEEGKKEMGSIIRRDENELKEEEGKKKKKIEDG